MVLPRRLGLSMKGSGVENTGQGPLGNMHTE